jgi:hypothetical protein
MLRNFALDQSGLTPENFTTLAYFSVSAAMSFPKSAGEPGSTVPPKSVSRAFILGSARRKHFCRLHLLTLGASPATREIETPDLRVDPGLSAVGFFITPAKSAGGHDGISRGQAPENPVNR